MRIVLIRPSHPGNIGATARAMKTMGVDELYLVAPKYFPHPEATALATHAEDLLNKAVVIQNLPQALVGTHHIYATSANHRQADLPVLTVRQAVAKMQTQTGNAVVIFGTENHGLSNAELQYAHYLIHIPTAPTYHSLNLAAAVQIVVYEWQQMQQQSISHSLLKSAVPLSVSVEQLEFFYQRLTMNLQQLNLLDPQNPRQLMVRLRRLFDRAQLSTEELQILHRILKAIEKLTAA